MRTFFALQEQPQPEPPAPAPAAPMIEINLDLSALANLIWDSFTAQIPSLGTAMWKPFEDLLRRSAQAIWDAAWGSSANIITSLPPELTYNFGPYRALAMNPALVAGGAVTLAVVLLGLRTILGSFVGGDHAAVHIVTRIIPAAFMAAAYPVIVVRGVTLVNDVARELGQVQIGQALAVSAPADAAALAPAYAVLWLLLIFYGVRLLKRLAYSLFRFLVALVFGPVAILLWAIPQTAWVTSVWVREFVGWGTTPLLVTACLALALPLANGREGFISAAVFGIAGLQAAYDLAGMLAFYGGARPGNLGAGAMGYARMALGSGGGAVAAGATSMAVAALPAAGQSSYGYQ